MSNQEEEYIIPCDISYCLADFQSETWEMVINEVDIVKESLLRTDAGLIVLPSKVMGEDSESEEQIPNPDKSINYVLLSHECFTTEYTNMVDWMKFHACLSHLPPEFRKINQGEYSEQKSIPQKRVVAFW